MALHLTQLSFRELTKRGRDLLAKRGMSGALDMPSCPSRWRLDSQS